jgi:hypothetical protein
VDDLREWVVSGIASPVPTWTPETTRQFALARASAVSLASRYAAAGFAVAVDDVISAESFQNDYAPHCAELKPHRVVLRPRLEVALQRNASRENKNFDTTLLEDVIRFLHADLEGMEAHGWQVIDSSELTLEDTVNLILERSEVNP